MIAILAVNPLNAARAAGGVLEPDAEWVWLGCREALRGREFDTLVIDWTAEALPEYDVLIAECRRLYKEGCITKSIKVDK